MSHPPTLPHHTGPQLCCRSKGYHLTNETSKHVVLLAISSRPKEKSPNWEVWALLESRLVLSMLASCSDDTPVSSCPWCPSPLSHAFALVPACLFCLISFSLHLPYLFFKFIFGRAGFLVWCLGFSLQWLLLLWSTGSRCVGFSSCGVCA